MTKKKSKKKKSKATSSHTVWITGSEIARGLALFIGFFSLLNLLGDLRYPGFDANHWWIDFRPVSPIVAHPLLAAASAALIAYGIRPRLSFELRLLTIALLVALLVVTTRNAIGFYVLLARSRITTGFPVAFSLFIMLALVVITLGVIFANRVPTTRTRHPFAAIGATIGVCLVAFPLGQIYCFGKTDYRRPADAIVVFGARTYADGSLSDALADRVRTACQLYADGYADTIIVSGGPGDGSISEPDAMKRVIIGYGVPQANVLTDPNGLNTRCTVINTTKMFPEIQAARILAVSHFYHLPRIKMTYQRYGYDVYTVGAEESYPLTKMPVYILREIVALWLYYLKPLIP